jgi:peptide/nickel transport system substrate-binding protein
VPEVAQDFPEVSDQGRTFTFKIRKGFRFSPPSNEEVTAESFSRAIERSVELTKLFGDDLRPPMDNIVGAQQFYAGKALRISGASARADELVLRFRKPEPDLPWLVAGSSCAVPVDLPVVKGGLEKPVPSAGPYYLATLTDSFAVLRQNPNYGGSRPQDLDAIVIKFSVAPSDAATQIENGTLDYFLESQQATLTPDTAAARAAGERYQLTSDTIPGVAFAGFNTDRPLFKDLRMRRAVQYALDRRALVRTIPPGGVPMPETRLLSSGALGYERKQLYPLSPDLPMARRLAAGRKAQVVVAIGDDPAYDQPFNRALRRQLAEIGLSMKVLPITNNDFADGGAGMLAKTRRADMFWGGVSAETADPANYLKDLYLPRDEWNEVRRIQKLFSPERQRAALALARRIERESLFAVFVRNTMPELMSKRLGCIVHQPEYAGVDLAALCLRDSQS